MADFPFLLRIHAMLLRLLLLFTLVPLAEFAILYMVAQRISLLATIFLVLLTGVVGSLLTLWQGRQAWQRFTRASFQGRFPAREINDGIMILVAGALLLTPGLLTDGVGFLLLMPWSRGWIRAALLRHFKSRWRVMEFRSSRDVESSGPFPSGRPDVVEGQAVREGEPWELDAEDARRLRHRGEEER